MRGAVNRLVLASVLAVLGITVAACGASAGSSAGKTPGVANPTAAANADASATAGASTSSSATDSAGGGNVKTIYLAGGCFWGLEKYVEQVRGVVSAEVGYANGKTPNATYGDSSGYAEAVKIEYDPDVAPLPFLLDLYYDAIDPTTLNRQGPDFGSEYRTGIYYTDPADRAVIEQSLAQLQTRYSKPVVIEVEPVRNYNAAEEYHQDYLEKNPGGYCHIPKKLFEEAAKARPK